MTGLRGSTGDGSAEEMTTGSSSSLIVEGAPAERIGKVFGRCRPQPTQRVEVTSRWCSLTADSGHQVVMSKNSAISTDLATVEDVIKIGQLFSCPPSEMGGHS